MRRCAGSSRRMIFGKADRGVTSPRHHGSRPTPPDSTSSDVAADELRAELELALGRHDLLLDRLRAAVAEEPLRERRWEQLMVALYRSGRQADALRAFQEARRVFVEELGIEPGRSLRELERAVLSQDPDLDAPARAPLLERPYHNLPSPLTALLGRFDDVQTVQKLLATSRLVTIAGTGGCGKTRLALAVAEEVCEQQADGAWFADLTPARTGELVAVHLASELGLREADEHGGAGPLDLVTRLPSTQGTRARARQLRADRRRSRGHRRIAARSVSGREDHRHIARGSRSGRRDVLCARAARDTACRRDARRAGSVAGRTTVRRTRRGRRLARWPRRRTARSDRGALPVPGGPSAGNRNGGDVDPHAFTGRAARAARPASVARGSRR